MLTRRTFLVTVASSLAAPQILRAATPKRLIFIHGRAQGGRDPSEIRAEWTSALAAGAAAAGHELSDRVNIVLPFYSDVLDEMTAAYDLPLTAEITTKGDEVQDRFLAFQSEATDQIRLRAGITDADVDAIYGDNPRPKGPENWEWLQAVFIALDEWVGGSGSRLVIERLLRDVFVYTSSTAARAAVIEIVRKELGDGPTVVVAHSLGTVVAYDILRDSASPEVPLFVTLGSPLGIRPIRRAVQPVLHPLTVSRWLNGYDSRDVVALFPLDSGNFDIMPAVENIGDLRNQTDNRHGISGYLDKPGIAGPVAAMFGT